MTSKLIVNELSADTGITTITVGGKISVSNQLDVGSNIKLGNAGVITATRFDGAVQNSGDFTIDDWIVHAGDTNTKFGFPAADTISLHTAGSERSRIDSSGNTCIGGGTDAVPTSSAYNSATCHLYQTGSSSVGSQLRFTTGASGHTASDGAYLAYFSDNHLYIYNKENEGISFGTNSTERARITSGGDFIIGNTTTTDGAHFQHYQSSARHQSFQSTNGDLAIVTDNNSNPAVYIKGTGTADLVNVFDNATEVFTIKDGGNLGINQSSPNARIEITDTSTAQIRLGYNQSKYIRIGRNSSGHYEFFSQENGSPLIFGTAASADGGGAEKMRIDRHGNVGIGITNPSQQLEVNGIVKVGSYFQAGRSGTGSNNWHFGAEGNGEFRVYSGDYGAGNERLRITSAGKVGIGTADPGSPLEVSGGSALDTATFNSHHSNGVLINLQRSGSNKGFLGSGKNIADATGGVDDIGLRSNANLIFTSGGGTERLRITSAGKFGIGLSAPTAKVAIVGGTASIPRLAFESGTDDNDFTFSQWEDGNGVYTMIGQNVKLDSNGNNDILDTGHRTAGITFDGRNHGALMFNTGDINAFDERMRINKTGSVGIGTIAPDVDNRAGLHIHSNHNDSCRLNLTTPTKTQCRIGYFGLNRFGMDVHGGFQIRDASASFATRLMCSSSGNWCMNGTDLSNAPFYGFFPDSGGGTWVKDTNSTNSRTAFIFRITGTERGSIKTAGSNTSFNTSSDYRLKENISIISDGITRLKQLKPSRFTWKEYSNLPFQDGFIAHEVSSIVPEAISGEKDGMAVETRYEEGDTLPSGIDVGDPKTFSTTEIAPQQIDLAKLVPLLTAALQEEITKREALEARIAALEGS